MRIEKVNDNQIRCTLTGEDLASRNIRVSELSYGSDKAKSLFRDLMQQASLMYNFDSEGMPLVVEAIPLNESCIVLLVTKVEDPEELDTRFASFSPSVQNETSSQSDETDAVNVLESLLGLIGNAAGQTGEGAQEDADDAPEEPAEEERPAENRAGQENGNGVLSDPAQKKQDRNANEELRRIRQYAFMHRLFVFDSMSELLDAAGLIAGSFRGHSALYQNESENFYYLVIVFDSPKAVSEQQSSLALLSEYSAQEIMSYAREQYLREHCRILIPENAVSVLSNAAG